MIGGGFLKEPSSFGRIRIFSDNIIWYYLFQNNWLKGEERSNKIGHILRIVETGQWVHMSIIFKFCIQV
jgi:hypothetical protein